MVARDPLTFRSSERKGEFGLRSLKRFLVNFIFCLIVYFFIKIAFSFQFAAFDENGGSVWINKVRKCKNRVVPPFDWQIFLVFVRRRLILWWVWVPCEEQVSMTKTTYHFFEHFRETFLVNLQKKIAKALHNFKAVGLTLSCQCFLLTPYERRHTHREIFTEQNILKRSPKCLNIKCVNFAFHFSQAHTLKKEVK